MQYSYYHQSDELWLSLFSIARYNTRGLMWRMSPWTKFLSLSIAVLFIFSNILYPGKTKTIIIMLKFFYDLAIFSFFVVSVACSSNVVFQTLDGVT